MGKSYYLVGVDEVGRGPIAGPVAVGVVIVKDQSFLKEIKDFLPIGKDSKKLSSKQREECFCEIIKWKDKGKIKYEVSFISSQIIDQAGISKSIQMAINRSFEKLNIPPTKSMILLDGGLCVGREYVNQKTIIRGDETEPIIACASIVAKVFRDRKMVNYGKKFPKYNFEIHKGYGTKKHFNMIKKHDFCPLHRRTFLKKLSS